TYAIESKEADLVATDIEYFADGVGFKVQNYPVRLSVPGRHNVLNALAALCTARALDIPLDRAISALEKFKGIARRLETVGTKNSITVIDDFGHNPDKIAATLRTLKEFDGRLLVMFQPHGFGPMKMMGRPIIET